MKKLIIILLIILSSLSVVANNKTVTCIIDSATLQPTFDSGEIQADFKADKITLQIIADTGYKLENTTFVIYTCDADGETSSYNYGLEHFHATRILDGNRYKYELQEKTNEARLVAGLICAEIIVKTSDANSGFVIIKTANTDCPCLKEEEGVKNSALIICPDCSAAAVVHPDSCSATKTLHNHFGEDIAYYTKHKKVYIYDFNKELKKRGYYKVTKVGTALHTEPVTFSREVLRQRDLVEFKIVNANKFMFDVSIADTLVDFDSKPSPLLNNFFWGDTNLLSNLISGYTGLIKGKSVDELYSTIDSASGKFSATPIICAIKCFTSDYIKLQEQILKAYDPCYNFPCCTKVEYKTLANKLLEIKLLLAKDEPEFAKLNTNISNAEKQINSLKESKKELDGMAADLKKIREKKPDDRSAEEKNKLKKGEELEALLKNDPLKELNEQLVTLNKDMDAYKSLRDLYTALPTLSDLKQMVTFINNMVEQNQTHMTEITSLNGNRLDIIVNIKVKDSIGKIVPAYDGFKYDKNIEIPIIWKPFISFSTGSFIGLSQQLQNKQYDWRALPTSGNVITSDSKYQLVESGYSLLPVGFAALANFQWKASRSFGLGPSAGVGLTIETKPRLGYLGGWSFYFGDLHQLAITGGVLAMQVDQLKNTLLVGHIYDAKPNLEPEYYKELKTGLFVSLTYTPFKNHRKLRPESEKNKNKNTTDANE